MNITDQKTLLHLANFIYQRMLILMIKIFVPKLMIFISVNLSLGMDTFLYHYALFKGLWTQSE